MDQEIAALILRRRQQVHVTEGAGPTAAVAAGVVVLEAELAGLGHLLTAPLRRALGALDADALARTGTRLLADVAALTGADRHHTPLFRSFPQDVPYQRAHRLYAGHILAALGAQPHQPCMDCGRPGRGVRAVAPCAHLVCASCLAETDFGCCEDCCTWYVCPVCETRYDTDGPVRPWLDVPSVEGDRDILRTLGLCTSPDDDAAAELRALLARRTPLDPQDHDDLVLLLNSRDPTVLSHALPQEIPVRESKALVLALLAEHEPDALDGYIDTATDVLRLLVVRSGGDPDLLEPVRLRSVPRALRRRLLGAVDRLDLRSAGADMQRRPGAFKRVGEVLHPFEHVRRHPRAALAFAVLRGLKLADEGEFTDALLQEAARHDGAVRLAGDRLRLDTWAGGVEGALASWDIPRATELLRERPGELLRRLDVLLSRSVAAGTPELLAEALGEALPGAGVGPLLGAWGKLAVRTVPGHRRVFFPRGRVTKAYAIDDHRPPLPRRAADRAAELIEAEAVRRMDVPDDRYDVAVLDAGLADLPVPYAERASAASLVAVPRGSSLRLPAPGDGRRLRLFLHWKQAKGQRVDLDLSVAFYDDQWRFVGLCDYTRLEWGGEAALHSGDLTSAPAPHGATEYVDLDLGRLRGVGVRFAVPVVLAYNDVPFDRLPDAFAGFMGVERGARGRFDARTVRQRFDLAGDAKALVPMVVDLRTLRGWWADVTLPVGDGNHNVWRHKDSLRRIGRDLLDAFQAGDRATLWDVACWAAAARTDGDIVVRGRGAAHWVYRRAEGEPRAEFALRVREGWEPDQVCAPAELPGRRVLAAVEYAELTDVLADSGTLYRLFPGEADAAGLHRVTAGDLVGWLAPGGS
ncbi:MXAN_6230/SCO0854 family RING domain-containing protein [Streptomyces sp. NPDC050264]|uniref:MXAN_6230/SCO0854 family RING domain-containing protein n=1 Tax=Streptomyces sp. NPDC050264 TaxID=3155038 RepID=UPI00341DA5CF